jgi:hypothetical protein
MAAASLAQWDACLLKNHKENHKELEATKALGSVLTFQQSAIMCAKRYTLTDYGFS